MLGNSNDFHSCSKINFRCQIFSMFFLFSEESTLILLHSIFLHFLHWDGCHFFIDFLIIFLDQKLHSNLMFLVICWFKIMVLVIFWLIWQWKWCLNGCSFYFWEKQYNLQRSNIFFSFEKDFYLMSWNDCLCMSGVSLKA